MEARYFKTPSEFRKWLSENHDDVDELWVGYYKKATGRQSITWPESVQEALCYGWIDGLRKSIDEKRYRIRFTPRRPKSNWSEVNISFVNELTKLGKMKPAGLRAFERRKDDSSSGNNAFKLGEKFEDELRSNKIAWKHFNALAPSVRKSSVYWVMSAKKEQTRLRRFAILIDSSMKGQKIPPLIPSKKVKN